MKKNKTSYSTDDAEQNIPLEALDDAEQNIPLEALDDAEQNIPLEALKADIKACTIEMRKIVESFWRIGDYFEENSKIKNPSSPEQFKEEHIVPPKRKVIFDTLLTMQLSSLHQLMGSIYPLLGFACRVPNKTLANDEKPNNWVRPIAIEVLEKMTKLGLIDMGFWIQMSMYAPKRVPADLIPRINDLLTAICPPHILTKGLEQQLEEAKDDLKRAEETDDDRLKAKSISRIEGLEGWLELLNSSPQEKK